MPPTIAEEAPSTIAYVGLGANLGDAPATLEAAFTALAALPATALRARSSIYRSAPIDSSGPDYLNAVAMLETALPSIALWGELQRIEHEHARERPYRNAPRTLDLDLLLYGELRIDTAALTLPHPRLHERAFVLLPLAQIAPGLMIPGRGVVGDLLMDTSAQRVERMCR